MSDELKIGIYVAGLLLTVLGWFVVYVLSLRTERRRERRADMERVLGIVSSIEERASQYYLEEERGRMWAHEIKKLFKRLSSELDGLELSQFDELYFQFKASVTDGDFEGRVLSDVDVRLERVSSSAIRLVDELRRWGRGK